jgi:hypothetical protein
MQTATKNRKTARQHTFISREMTASQFRTEAINAVGNAISQRKAIQRTGKSYLVVTQNHIHVETIYKAHRADWTVRGVSRFILENQVAILQLIPWTNTVAIKRFRELVDLAFDFQNIEG